MDVLSNEHVLPSVFFRVMFFSFPFKHSAAAASKGLVFSSILSIDVFFHELGGVVFLLVVLYTFQIFFGLLCPFYQTYIKEKNRVYIVFACV